MTRAEQETIIRWDDDEKVAWLYTCSPVTQRKWLKKGYLLTKDGHGWRARIPARLVRFGKPPSERQLAAAARSRLLAREPKP